MLESFFPIWDRLDDGERRALADAAVSRFAPRGTLLHSGADDCVGLFAVRSGQLRAFILSDEGREVTLYRLFERDICLFSASCIMNSIQFDVTITAEKDSELWVIPAETYKAVMTRSAALANYTNELMASRFSEVMWLVEQVMWRSIDKRLAAFLIEESTLEGTTALSLTHDAIANHMGTAREVVTRMLRYFSGEGLVRLSRGKIRITDEARLRSLAR